MLKYNKNTSFLNGSASVYRLMVTSGSGQGSRSRRHTQSSKDVLKASLFKNRASFIGMRCAKTPMTQKKKNKNS